jgi:hypothetical protein
MNHDYWYDRGTCRAEIYILLGRGRTAAAYLRYYLRSFTDGNSKDATCAYVLGFDDRVR